ncbi:hypothetical protein G6F22_020138 [Rhizopus arrhizus]|nr:hypothetical protein G6F22_020138 [Rhizopus arrhizus]
MQVDFAGQVERRGQVGFFARAQGADGFVEHLVVHRETHFLDVARLRIAKHFARAPDFQIVHGQVEARAQYLHGLDRFQALLGVGRDGIFARRQQVGVGLMV